MNIKLKHFGIVAASLLLVLYMSSCVTVEEATPQQTAEPAEEAEAPPQEDNTAVIAEETEEESDRMEKSGILYSSMEIGEGPLLLGSKEYMSGPIVEFTILYSLYFPLSGIEPPFSGYKPGKGTRWQVDSNRLEETVFFERALLGRDDEEKSWWLFEVSGNGFERRYEFLVDRDWKLMEMRYLLDEEIKSYIPSVDENSNMSVLLAEEEPSESEKVKIQTFRGEIVADHFFAGETEFWKARRVTGNYLQSRKGKEEELILSASLLEEKEGYEGKFGTY